MSTRNKKYEPKLMNVMQQMQVESIKKRRGSSMKKAFGQELYHYYGAEINKPVNAEDVERGYVTIKVDPYEVINAYRISDPAHQHALKKLMRAGESQKSYRKDITEIRDGLNRMIEMMIEQEKIDKLCGKVF